MNAASDSKNVYIPDRRDDARLIIYGIAHAGAGASPWRTVSAALPPWVEVRGIRLPGRESRTAARAHTDIDAAAHEVGALIASDPVARDRPAVLVGSCFGSLIATAAAGRVPVSGLVAVRQPVPAQMFVNRANPTAMESDRFRQWLLEYKLTPPTLLSDDAFEFFEPIIRADLHLIDGYATPEGSLTCPVHLVHCPFTPEEPDLERWANVTSGPVTLTRLEGSGDPLTEHPEDLARAIEEFVHPLAEGS